MYGSPAPSVQSLALIYVNAFGNSNVDGVPLFPDLCPLQGTKLLQAAAGGVPETRQDVLVVILGYLPVFPCSIEDCPQL